MRKRLISILLIAALLAACLVGCGEDLQEETQKTKVQTEESAPQNEMVYQAEFIALTTHTGEMPDYVSCFCISDGKAYYSASYMEGETYLDGLFVMNLETREVISLDGLALREIPEGMEGDSSIRQLLAGTDGTIWVALQTSTYSFDLPENFDEESDSQWNYYTEGETFCDLLQLDSNGEVLKTLTLDLDPGVYLSTVMMDSDENVFAYDWATVYVYDSQGQRTATVDNEGYGDLVRISTDEIGLITSSDAERTIFQAIDPANGELGPEVTMQGYLYQIYPGFDNYRYVYQDSDYVYGQAEGAEAPELLFSWLDCDVDSSNVESLTFLEDGRVAALERNYSSGSSETGLVLMEQAEAASLPEKQELTLACLNLSWDLRTKIVEFNRSHDDVRIVVQDYSTEASDGDQSQALQKLNTELLSGNVPDILLTDDMPLERYAAKGLLVDLWPLIDSDSELSRENLMEHLFEAMSIDEKLYQVVENFSIRTTAVKSSLVGDKTTWTLDEMLQVLESLEEGAGIFDQTTTKTQILQACVESDLASFVDWENSMCMFDSDAFVDLLVFADNFLQEFDWESYDYEAEESEYSRLMNGRQLMTECTINSFPDLQVQYAFQNGDVTFIGYPSSNSTGSTFQISSGLAITTACENQELAWSFVRELLLEENQTSDWLHEFPTNRGAFETYLDERSTPIYETDPETDEQVEISNWGYAIGNDFSCDIYALTEAELDAFWKLYESCNSVYSADQEILNIILDEADAFFAGNKDADETAKLIQDRVSLYIFEQG